MADDLASVARILSRAAQRLTTQVNNTVESNLSFSVAAPVAAGPSRADGVSRMEKSEIEIAFSTSFPSAEQFS